MPSAAAVSFTAIDWTDTDVTYSIDATIGDENSNSVTCDVEATNTDFMPGTDESYYDETDARGADVVGDGVEVGTGLSAADACPIFSPASIDGDGEDVEDETIISLDFSTDGGLIHSGGTVATENVIFEVTTSGQARVAYDAAESCSSDVADYDTTVEYTGESDDYMEICVIPSSGDASGTGTVTLKAYHGGKTTTIETWYFDFYGPVTSVAAATPNFKHLAGDADWATQTTLIFKDAAGTDLLAAGLTTQDTIECVSMDELGDNDACDADDDAEIHFIVGGKNVENDDSAGDTQVYFDGDSEDGYGPVVQIGYETTSFCDEFDLAPGDSTTIRAFIDNDGDARKDASELQTAAWSVTCTGDSDTASISSISVATTAQRASTSSTDRTIELVVNVVDEDGIAMGYLGDSEYLTFDDTGYSEDYEVAYKADDSSADVDPSVNLDLSEVYVVDGSGLYDVGDGYEYLSDFTPEAFELTVGSREYTGWNEFIITIDDNLVDGGGDTDVEFSFAYRVATRLVTITATGMSVTANFGQAAAGKTVTLLVEKLNGDVLYRSVIANSKGVIKRTFKGAQKTVTAFLGNSYTNTVTVK